MADAFHARACFKLFESYRRICSMDLSSEILFLHETFMMLFQSKGFNQKETKGVLILRYGLVSD